MNLIKQFNKLNDKLKHLICGFGITIIIGLILSNPALGFIIGVCIGALKEVWDYLTRFLPVKNGTPDLWDLIVTIIGCLSGLCLLLLI